jgi:hypothetical protein
MKKIIKYFLLCLVYCIFSVSLLFSEARKISEIFELSFPAKNSYKMLIKSFEEFESRLPETFNLTLEELDYLKREEADLHSLDTSLNRTINDNDYIQKLDGFNERKNALLENHIKLRHFIKYELYKELKKCYDNILELERRDASAILLLRENNYFLKALCFFDYFKPYTHIGYRDMEHYIDCAIKSFNVSEVNIQPSIGTDYLDMKFHTRSLNDDLIDALAFKRN